MIERVSVTEFLYISYTHMSIIVLYNERVCCKLSTFISFSFLLFLLRALCYQSFHSSYQPSLLLSAFRPSQCYVWARGSSLAFQVCACLLTVATQISNMLMQL